MKQVVLAIVAACATACGNVSGRINAIKTGDDSNPAERGSPVDALRDACGDGTPTTHGTRMLTRHPYLQRVTQDSAMVGWVSSDGEHELVTVTKPSGAVVATAPGEHEPNLVMPRGEHQRWFAMSSLEPATIYCYELSGSEPMHARTGFRTAPTPDDPEPVRFLAFGDSGGGGADQYALLEQMYTVPFDLMIHTGDIAYSDGTLEQFERNVFDVYADLWRNIPFFPAPGNHDYRTYKGAPYRAVFNLPGDNEKWYSYDWGRVHFVALDTESDYATQAEWLDRDLEANDLPWTIVYLHKPLYSSGEHGSDRDLRKILEPVLVKHGVQLVLAGHDHDYERTAPQQGVVHVVTGGGGIGTRSVGTSSFTEFAEDVIHFVYVEVFADKLVLHAIDATGREFDSVVISRD